MIDVYSLSSASAALNNITEKNMQNNWAFQLEKPWLNTSTCGHIAMYGLA